MAEFKPFPKIPRLLKDIIITEKIDGTNASIYIGEDGEFLTGSRNKWITPESDNFGFARWAQQNKEDLMQLGPGHHFGEWWGLGIQRGYDLSERRFSLFHASGIVAKPDCVSIVPVLYAGMFDPDVINSVMVQLRNTGSEAAPGYMNPEGVVVYHTASRQVYKVPFYSEPKGARA